MIYVKFTQLKLRSLGNLSILKIDKNEFHAGIICIIEGETEVIISS